MSLPAEPLVLTMAETAALMRISLRSVKAMVADGRIHSVKLGRRRLVSYDSLRQLVNDR